MSAWPKCTHRPKANRVTNWPADKPYVDGEPHASAWICDERACVFEAMAWVERETEQHAIVYGPLASLGATS